MEGCPPLRPCHTHIRWILLHPCRRTKVMVGCLHLPEEKAKGEVLKLQNC